MKIDLTEYADLVALMQMSAKLEEEQARIFEALPALYGKLEHADKELETVLNKRADTIAAELHRIGKKLEDACNAHREDFDKIINAVNASKRTQEEYAKKTEREIPPPVEKKIKALFAEIPKPKDGAPGSPGKPGKDANLLTGFRGNWSDKIAYKAGETFTFRGSFYLCTADVKGVLPSVKSQTETNPYYAVLAISGAPGLPGAGTAGGGSGSGDVSGPVSSTNNAISRWDGTGGDTLKDSAATIDDSGNITCAGVDTGDGAFSIGSIAPLTAPGMASLGATTELPRGPAPFEYQYYKVLSAGLTLTDAAGTPTDGHGHRVIFIGDGTARTIAIPSSYSEAAGANITSFVVPVNGQVTMTRQYSNSAWRVYGDPQTLPITAGGTGATTAAGAMANLGLSNGVGFVVNGNGAAITTGVKTAYVKAPFGGTLTGWTLISSPSGAITIDILRSADGAGLPATSIVGGGGTKPAVAAGTQNSSTSFTGWTSTAITALDNFTVEVTAADGTVTYANLILYYR